VCHKYHTPLPVIPAFPFAPPYSFVYLFSAQMTLLFITGFFSSHACSMTPMFFLFLRCGGRIAFSLGRRLDIPRHRTPTILILIRPLVFPTAQPLASDLSLRGSRQVTHPFPLPYYYTCGVVLISLQVSAISLRSPPRRAVTSLADFLLHLSLHRR